MIDKESEIAEILARKINLPEINEIVEWALGDGRNIDALFRFAKSEDRRTGLNALWSLTHLQKNVGGMLQGYQDELVDMLLEESYTGRKRMLLQLLREQTYDMDTLRTDFLDYCLCKINSVCEPYAIRCFSIYCAFKMCKFYPELIAELEAHLDMLPVQSLSPGLKSALKSTRRRIDGVRKRHGQ